MVPFSGTKLSRVFRLFDVDVALCGYAVVTRGAEGSAGLVTSDDITFSRHRFSKLRVRCVIHNKQGYKSTFLMVFIVLEQTPTKLRGPPKPHPHHQRSPSAHFKSAPQDGRAICNYGELWRPSTYITMYKFPNMQHVQEISSRFPDLSMQSSSMRCVQCEKPPVQP